MARTRSHTRRAPRSNPRGVLAVRRSGYGFVQTPEGEYFIPAAMMNGAFDGDTVEIAPIRDYRAPRNDPGGRKRAARILRVVERAHMHIVGRYRVVEPFGIVEPADERIPYDIFTRRADDPSIPDGAIVRVEITVYPSRREAACGNVVEVIGDEDDERVPIDLIIARHKLETRFSDAALAQARQASVEADAALAEGYVDLRKRFIFTIDPADARDFDDAVSIEPVVRTDDGRIDEVPAGDPEQAAAGIASGAVVSGQRCWRLGVHIADVSHYVPWGSSVDLDARRRATSVYLADRVIPMLPAELSDDICSLKPGKDRRAMTVDMVMDEDGHIVESHAYPALICSRARLSYEEAQELIDGAAQGRPELAERLRVLDALASKRRSLREKAGGIDFDTVEAKVRLDDAGAPLEVVMRRRTPATQLIEEAMLAANETVARRLLSQGFPCMFRVHERPARETLEGLAAVFDEFPWFTKVDRARFCGGDPFSISQVLVACAGRPEAELATALVLRAMKRAVYSPEPQGHYALASAAYAHFTSPIRRYPDLVVHRMLRAQLMGRPGLFDQEVSQMAWLAEHSSRMERVAERAARESQEVKIIELLEAHVGETFSALIAGVATYGLFVRLDNTAEGMVEIRDLGDEYFSLDPIRHTLTGSDTGKVYRLGRHIAVRLVEADHATHTLRFRLA